MRISPLVAIEHLDNVLICVEIYHFSLLPTVLVVDLGVIHTCFCMYFMLCFVLSSQFLLFKCNLKQINYLG